MSPIRFPAYTAFPPDLQQFRQIVVGLDNRGPNARWPHPFFASIPALFAIGLPSNRSPESMFGKPGRAIVVRLDREFIAKTMMPRLVERYFSTDGSVGYDVALLASQRALFQSSPGWPAANAPADVTLEIAPIGRPIDSAEGRARLRGKTSGRKRGGKVYDLPAPPSAVWRLAVRRRDGGLEAIIASTKRRNLALSFGILVVLGASMVLLLALLRRADLLRKQQAEFVAAMTHELNTPVTALRSAGENLKDGIVADREKVARYGETIVRESSRLGEMIAEVLELAGMQARAERKPHEPVDLAAIVDDALAQARVLGDIPIEVSIDPPLPPVSGDAKLLTRAVQNLVANAIRHGGSGNWIGVRVAAGNGGGVRITVEDRGPGVGDENPEQLFEPFYRGRRSARVSGAGLGLSIVKQIATEHGGSVRVERRSSGAAFTIRLPEAK